MRQFLSGFISALRSLTLCASCVSTFSALKAEEQGAAIPEIGEAAKFEKALQSLEVMKGHILFVPFPLAEADDRQLRLRIEKILDRHDGNGRPVIVLRFVAKALSNSATDPSQTKTLGRGTEFERSLSFARWLVGPVGVRARTVAYLPDSAEGHSVLVAMACEEIAMAPLAEMGRAAIDEVTLDQVVIDGYLGIAQRRGAFPPDAVRAMLDRDVSLFRVELVGEKTAFLSSSALEPIRQSGRLVSETQLSIPGQLGKFTGQEMRTWRWITHLARDEEQLREVLGATVWEKQKSIALSDRIKPALIEIRGAVSKSAVNRWLRAIDEARGQDAANLLILHLQSSGGSLSESLRLAEYLANLDETSIETVAWIDGEARGDAALIGLACDSLLAKPAAIIGGPGEATIDSQSIRGLADTWRQLSQATNRTESELYGLLCPDLELNEFQNEQGRIEIGDAELFSKRDDFDEWKVIRKVAFPRGITAEEAVQRNWASATTPNLLAVAEQRGIDKLPPPKRVTQLEHWIRSFADQDWLATLLLTLSLMLFTNELTTPGLGLAGFLSLLCISLFFWMRFLDGTVEWLEVTLFIAGILALGLELFVLPGFGVFGFGGFIMIACGIVLASQTFIIPSNDYQWRRLATSTVQLAVACLGLMAMVYMLRNQLERLPFFRMLKLEPPPSEVVREATEDLNYLIGKRGTTTSRCAPIGKALIGDRYFDIHSPDDLLEPETAIDVIDVQGRTIFVRRVPSMGSVS